MPATRPDRADSAMRQARSLVRRGRRSPIHERLRAETRALHHALEADLDLLGPGLSVDRYAVVLQAFHAYYAALEPRLSALAARVSLGGFALRERAPLLERDLLALGARCHARAARSAAVPLPMLSRSEHLAGCLYVIEGAALGGQVITRALQRRLGLTAAHGCAFFGGEGAETAARWRAVLHWIDALVIAGANGQEVVHTANETFHTLNHWLQRQGAMA